MLGSLGKKADERRIGMRRYEVAFGDAQAGVPAPHEAMRPPAVDPLRDTVPALAR